MAIAPLEHPLEDPRFEGRPPLRLVDGGRRPGAPRRGAAIHARRAPAPRHEAESRAAHPTAPRAEDPFVRPRREAVPPAGARVVSLEVAAATHRALSPEEREQRRAAVRAQTLARRRRSMGVLAALAALAALALPIHALGGVTLSGQAAPGGVPTGLADGSTYVVAQGDTLASIAQKVNPSAVGLVVHELAAALGTTEVVPGERIRIP